MTENNDNVNNALADYNQDPSPPEIEPDLDYFHLKNKKTNEITGVFDVRIREYIKKHHPLFMVSKLPYIYDHGYFKPDYNGTKLKTMISKCIYPAYVKATTIKRVFDLFVADDELQASYDQLNNYSDKLVNFRKGMFDAINWKMLQHDPDYKSINQIPFDFDPDTKPEKNEIDAFLESAIPDLDDREMLLEYLGLCFTKDTSQQVFLILVGIGGSGKSTLINMIINVIGKENVSSVSLKGLSERFATADLVGKLLNSCADLEEGALDDPTVIKKLLGEDRMRGERKGQDAFDFESYAKLIFSSNDIPVIKAERSDGFYRRLLVCPMYVKPDEVDPDLFNKLKECKSRFVYLCMRALMRLYKRGTILRSPHSEQYNKQLRNDSDSVQAFLDECMEQSPECKIERRCLFEKYLKYCDQYQRIPVTNNRFYSSMRAKGYMETRDSQARYFIGITVKTVTLIDTSDTDSNNNFDL